MREAVIVSSMRTGMAKSYRGSFNVTRPDELCSHALVSALDAVPNVDKSEIEDVVIGCGFPEGPQGMNVARVATLGAGLPETVAATTVNRFCSSGLQAVPHSAAMQSSEMTFHTIGDASEHAMTRNSVRVKARHHPHDTVQGARIALSRNSAMRDVA